MVRPLIALALSPALLLAACNDGPGTSISIDAKGDDGNGAVTVDKDGRVSVKAPGFESSIKLPKIQIDAEDFEINGLRLYPGSTIDDLNVDAKDNAGGKDEGTVRVGFAAPAASGAVRDWFRKSMADKGFTVEAKGSGLAGKTRDGDPFTLELTPGGEGRTRGVLAVTG